MHALPDLRPLILMLSSNQPGEVFAAAQMIGRKLEQSGLDWHALADALERGPAEPEPCAEPMRYRCAEDWSDVVNYLLLEVPGDSFSEREARFVYSMREILFCGWTPTEKQAAWLRALFERAGGEWADAAA